MFTGIIKNTGKLTKILKKGKNVLIEVSSNINFKKNEIGSSISCSGVCLTLEKYTNKSCRFYISKETINRTIFKYSKKGEIVNCMGGWQEYLISDGKGVRVIPQNTGFPLDSFM